MLKSLRSLQPLAVCCSLSQRLRAVASCLQPEEHSPTIRLTSCLHMQPVLKRKGLGLTRDVMFYISCLCARCKVSRQRVSWSGQT
eukprot:scaffold277908_cov15-Tisochrysis_lutea.AAC.2